LGITPKVFPVRHALRRGCTAEAIAEGAQRTVAASAAIEVGAIGLGTLIVILATTMTAGVTGVLLASLVAILRLFVIPAALYTRFVRAERGRLLDTQTELEKIKDELDRLKVKVGEI